MKVDLRFLSLTLQRIRQSQLRGPKGVIINYWWLPSLTKPGARRHQMCGRGRGAKGLSLPWHKQCSNLAVMHFCLIDCFDAGFLSILFLRGHWCLPLPSLDEENSVGFQLHPARTFRRFFWWQKKATGDLRGLIGLHLCISTITLHFWFLTRNEWGGKVMRKGHTAGVNECTWHIACVCVWWYFLVRVRLQWKERPGTHKPHEGSPYLHN